MAVSLSVNVYGVNGNALSTNQTWGFPTQNIIIRPAGAGITMMGVPILTVIQLLPAGTKVGQDQYQSPTATATVITSANS